MIIIRAKYKSGNEFIEAYQSNFQHGGVFLPTRKKLEIGRAVVLDVRFSELKSTVLVRGIINWRRPGKRRSNIRAGLGIEFLPSEWRKREFLYGVAQGKILDTVQRRHRRLPVEISVDWREKANQNWQLNHLQDIGEGGAFICTTNFQPVGSTLILEIAAPGGERKLPIEATVAWNCHNPNEEGIGIEFRCRDLGGARRIKELIRRLENAEPHSFLPRSHIPSATSLPLSSNPSNTLS